MNILYITHTTDGSGARVALANLAKEMVARGHGVFVFVPRSDCPAADSMRAAGATVLVAPVCATAYPNTKNPFKWLALLALRLWKWRRSRREIRRAIGTYGIDIVHSNVGPLNLAQPVCRELGKPHVWHIREFQEEIDIRFFPQPSLFRQEIVREGNYNIAITRAVFEHYALREGVDRVLYDGVFPAGIADQELQPFCRREKTVLFVGRVEAAKGTLDLIEAFIQFHRTHGDWDLRLVGSYKEDDAYCQACRRACETSGCPENIEFLGKRSDVYALLREARIVVMPSPCEGFGFVTAEAMANGCLVIGRDAGGTKEQMDNGLRLTGGEIALRFGTREELQAQLCDAAENDHSDLIGRGRRAAVELYSLERTAGEVEAYYRWIMEDYYDKKS